MARSSDDLLILGLLGIGAYFLLTQKQGFPLPGSGGGVPPTVKPPTGGSSGGGSGGGMPGGSGGGGSGSGSGITPTKSYTCPGSGVTVSDPSLCPGPGDPNMQWWDCPDGVNRVTDLTDCPPYRPPVEGDPSTQGWCDANVDDPACYGPGGFYYNPGIPPGPPDSGDPCDPNSVQFNQAVCNEINGVEPQTPDSGNPCDPASAQFNQTICDEMAYGGGGL